MKGFGGVGWQRSRGGSRTAPTDRRGRIACERGGFETRPYVASPYASRMGRCSVGSLRIVGMSAGHEEARGVDAPVRVDSRLCGNDETGRMPTDRPIHPHPSPLPSRERGNCSFG